MLSLGKRKVPDLGRVLIQRTFPSGFSTTSSLTSLPAGKDSHYLAGPNPNATFLPTSSYRFLADKKAPTDKKAEKPTGGAKESNEPELVLFDAPVEKRPPRNKGNAENAPKATSQTETLTNVVTPTPVRGGRIEVTLEEISEAFAKAEAEAEEKGDLSYLSILDNKSFEESQLEKVQQDLKAREPGLFDETNFDEYEMSKVRIPLPSEDPEAWKDIPEAERLDLLDDLDPEHPEVAKLWKQIDEWEPDDAEIDRLVSDDFDIEKATAETVEELYNTVPEEFLDFDSIADTIVSTLSKEELMEFLEPVHGIVTVPSDEEDPDLSETLQQLDKDLSPREGPENEIHENEERRSHRRRMGEEDEEQDDYDDDFDYYNEKDEDYLEGEQVEEENPQAARVKAISPDGDENYDSALESSAEDDELPQAVDDDYEPLTEEEEKELFEFVPEEPPEASEGTGEEFGFFEPDGAEPVDGYDDSAFKALIGDLEQGLDPSETDPDQFDLPEIENETEFLKVLSKVMANEQPLTLDPELFRYDPPETKSDPVTDFFLNEWPQDEDGNDIHPFDVARMAYEWREDLAHAGKLRPGVWELPPFRDPWKLLDQKQKELYDKHWAAVKEKLEQDEQIKEADVKLSQAADNFEALPDPQTPQEVDEFLKQNFETNQVLDEIDQAFEKREQEIEDQEVPDLYPNNVLLGDQILKDPDTLMALTAAVGEDTAKDLMKDLEQSLRDYAPVIDVTNTETEADPLKLLRTDPDWQKAERIYEERKKSHILARVGEEKFKKLYPGQAVPAMPPEPEFDPEDPLRMSLLYPYRDSFDIDMDPPGPERPDRPSLGASFEDKRPKVPVIKLNEDDQPDHSMLDGSLLSELDVVVKKATHGLDPKSELYRDLYDLAFADPFGNEDDELDEDDPHNKIDMKPDPQWDYLQLEDDDTDIVVREPFEDPQYEDADFQSGELDDIMEPWHQRPLEEERMWPPEEADNEEDVDPMTEVLEQQMDVEAENPRDEPLYDDADDRKYAEQLRKEKESKAQADRAAYETKKAEMEALEEEYEKEIQDLHAAGDGAAAKAKETEYRAAAARMRGKPPSSAAAAAKPEKAAPSEEDQPVADVPLSEADFEALMEKLLPQQGDVDVEADIRRMDPHQTSPHLFYRPDTTESQFDLELDRIVALSDTELPELPEEQEDPVAEQMLKELGLEGLRAGVGLEIDPDALESILDPMEIGTAEAAVDRKFRKAGWQQEGLPVDDSSIAATTFETKWVPKATIAELEQAFENFQALLGLYLQNNMLDEAMKHFEYAAFAAHKWRKLEPEMCAEWGKRILSPVHFNALMAASIDQENYLQAASVFKSMAKYCIPDQTSFELMLSVYGQRKESNFVEMDALLDHMHSLGIPPSGVILDLLSNANFRAKDYEVCLELWEEFDARKLEPSVHSYAYAISSYCRLGRFDKGLELFKRSKAQGIAFESAQLPFLYDLNARLAAEEAVRQVPISQSSGSRPSASL